MGNLSKEEFCYNVEPASRFLPNGLLESWRIKVFLFYHHFDHKNPPRFLFLHVHHQHHFFFIILIINIPPGCLGGQGFFLILNLDTFLPYLDLVFQVAGNQVIEATRFALDPYKVQLPNMIIIAINTTILIITIVKVHHATLGKDDFLEPKKLPSGKDFVIVDFTDEFPDVNVKVKIYQKISQGIHVPAGKFGIMLESEHHPKVGCHHHQNNNNHHHNCHA